MSVSLVVDPAFLDHDPGRTHPEHPGRLSGIEALLAAEPIDAVRVQARPARRDELERVHSTSHVDRMLALDGRSAVIDPDTRTSPGSVQAALRAAGGSVELACGVARGTCPPGLALVRPPGHHATRHRAMGFCLFNNVAVAAAALRAEGLAERVAIYDFDVHHGNGTQDIFEADPDVLYLSTHQYPFYPGSGAASERGVGAGEGATLNVPLRTGARDAELLAATEEVFVPALERFRPDFILLSAGFDAHEEDPLGGLLITDAGYARLAARWAELAAEHCGGRFAGVLEGGYDVAALGRSVRAVLAAWGG